MERVTLQLDDDIIDLFGCQYVDLTPLDLRGPHRAGDVAGKRLALNSPLQSPMQNTMSMAHCACRQGTPFLAACLQDGAVPVLDVGWLELLHGQRAEVRYNLLFCELPVSLRSFGR